jgi:phage FluMu protein Com
MSFRMFEFKCPPCGQAQWIQWGSVWFQDPYRKPSGRVELRATCAFCGVSNALGDEILSQMPDDLCLCGRHRCNEKVLEEIKVTWYGSGYSAPPAMHDRGILPVCSYYTRPEERKPVDRDQELALALAVAQQTEHLPVHQSLVRSADEFVTASLGTRVLFHERCRCQRLVAVHAVGPAELFTVNCNCSTIWVEVKGVAYTAVKYRCDGCNEFNDVWDKHYPVMLEMGVQLETCPFFPEGRIPPPPLEEEELPVYRKMVGSMSEFKAASVGTQILFRVDCPRCHKIVEVHAVGMAFAFAFHRVNGESYPHVNYHCDHCDEVVPVPAELIPVLIEHGVFAPGRQELQTKRRAPFASPSS